MPSTPKYKPSIIRTLLSDQLKAAGFKQIRSNWRREWEECFHLANIQRSTYGPYYFLNFAIFYKEVEPDVIPHRAFGHLNFRAGDHGPEGIKKTTARMFDEDEAVSDEARAKFIQDTLWKEVEATFERFRHLSAAVEYAKLPWEQSLSPTVHRILRVFVGHPTLPEREIY